MRDTLRELLFSSQSSQRDHSQIIDQETLKTSRATSTNNNNTPAQQHPARRRAARYFLTSEKMTQTLACGRVGAQTNNFNSSHLRSSPKTKERYLTRGNGLLVAGLCLVVMLASLSQVAQASEQDQQKQQIDLRSTQPTLDRQVETPSGSSSSGAQSALVASSSVKPPAADKLQQHESSRTPVNTHKPQKPLVSLASQKKAAALAAQRDYDKYQLKASPSSHSPHSSTATTAGTTTKPAASGQVEKEKEKEKAIGGGGANNNEKQSSSTTSNGQAGGESGSVQPAHKKIGQHPHTRQPSSAFSLLKKFLPSFMTSGAGPAVAAAAAAASAAVADKQQHSNQHSRSSPSGNLAGPSSLLSSLLSSSGGGSSSGAGGKIINLLSGASKKKGILEGAVSAIPNHAPFFMRKSAVADRQAGGGGALALASGLLSNPLKLGLLFSAPLLPSLLLTPLAIAGLSPAMSAINNFFGDDDEPAAASQSPLAAFASGSNSPLASILQATGASPFGSSGSSSSSSSIGDSSSSGSASSPANSFALQAFQSFLGPTSTTERPLFNPGMFASSGIQNAAGALGSALSGSSSSNSGSSSSSSGSGQSRPLFGSGGGGLMQAAASMISPSFAAPPSSSSSSSSDDDGPGLMQMASDVFEKVANYMGTDNKDGQPAAASGSIGQASGGQPSSPVNSPLSTLASLSSLSPFQLSSLFASTPLGSALAGSSKPTQASGASSSSSSSLASGGSHTHRAGFFSTLRNVYELFSSSFLRRQEVGNENECQQRLVCELHQRAMNSKFFKRSLQANLNELASLDKNLIEQIKYSSQTLQARVDPDTKAMLSDFLKATNNFKSGREMINCSQMFPKCTRTQLLAAVNAHMSDPVNGRAIGKFSQLMKKMKYKSNQQHQSQWKLRKPSAKSQGAVASVRGAVAPMASSIQPIDYLQVAPLNKPGQATNGQLTPVDSLKLAQQIMMLSQMSNQPQQQQQSQQPQPQQQVSNSPVISQYVPTSSNVAQQQQQYNNQYGNQYNNQQQPSQSQPAGYSASPSYISGQYSPAPTRQTTYTDAIMPPVYSATDSPYFMPAQIGAGNQQPQQQQYIPEQQTSGQTQQYSQQQQQQQPQQSQSMVSNQQQYTPTGQMGSASQLVQDQPMAQQQQQQPQQQQQQQQSIQGSNNMDNKNQPQQLLTPKKSQVAVAA